MSEQLERRPGRPPNSARAQDTQQQRRRRETLSDDRFLKLSVPESSKDKNFVYRWLNDTPGRLESKTVHDDWDIVKEGADPTKDNGEGAPVRRPVGATAEGKPLYAYLCRKPRGFYEDDKAKEQKSVDESEESLRKGEAQGADALVGPHAYVPGGRNTIKHG